MKDIFTYLTESANGGRAVEMRIKSKRDFLIQVSNASKLDSKFEQNIKTIVKHVLGLNTVTVYVDEKFEIEDIKDNTNQIVGKIEDNNGKCVVLFVIENDDKEIMNAFQPVLLAHDFYGKRFKDIIIGVATTKNFADNLNEPLKARLGSPITM